MIITGNKEERWKAALNGRRQECLPGNKGDRAHNYSHYRAELHI